jgi:hypothetical protein
MNSGRHLFLVLKLTGERQQNLKYDPDRGIVRQGHFSSTRGLFIFHYSPPHAHELLNTLTERNSGKNNETTVIDRSMFLLSPIFEI